MIGSNYNAVNSYNNVNTDSCHTVYNAGGASSQGCPADDVSAKGGQNVPAGNTAVKTDPEAERTVIRNPGESTEKKAGRKSSPAECQTCKERKYQDGSDENVSFKAASHIDPGAAASRVRSHEQEHVSNAYKDAAQNNGKVLSCSVTIKSAVCPECGRTYVSGGTTATQIRYYNEENPYQKDMKSADAAGKYRGRNFDAGF